MLGADEEVKEEVKEEAAAAEGREEQQQPGEAGPNLQLAEGFLAMAACVDPSHEDAGDALGVVREALRIRAESVEGSGRID